MLKNKITNEIKISKWRKIPNNKYLFYNIEIKNYIILIKEKNNILDNILFKYNIEDNNFFSIKIHGDKSENYRDYKEKKIKIINYKLFDTEYREHLKIGMNHINFI